MEDQAPQSSTASGWYEQDGGLRYWTGEEWAGGIVPKLAAPAQLTRNDIALGVFAGVLAALFVVWLGAQVSPEHVYLPVKFVVKELP